MFDNSQPENKNKLGTEVKSLLQHPNLAVWEHIFDSLPDMIALIDNQNCVVKVNRAMQERLDLTESKMLGNKCYELMHAGKCEAAVCPHAQMLRDKVVHTAEFFESKFNSYFKVTTTPIFDENNNLLGSLHLMHDITIEKESEAKLIQFNSELDVLNKNKDKFFSIVAHDLRSPFQGMLGFTDLILEEIETLSRAEIENYLKHVQESSYSAFSMLENLLSWSRLQAGRIIYNPISFDLFKEIDSIISLLNSNANKKGITIVNQINLGTFVKADKHMIHSVLLNLLTNAIKFSEKGKAIHIGCHLNYINNGNRLNIDSKSSIEIFIKDFGVGMSQETLQKIVEVDKQFTSLGTNNESGSGIGLFIVREMIEKHGTVLKIESKLGEGSKFSFALPLDYSGSF